MSSSREYDEHNSFDDSQSDDVYEASRFMASSSGAELAAFASDTPYTSPSGSALRSSNAFGDEILLGGSTAKSGSDMYHEEVLLGNSYDGSFQEEAVIGDFDDADVDDTDASVPNNQNRDASLSDNNADDLGEEFAQSEKDIKAAEKRAKKEAKAAAKAAKQSAHNSKSSDTADSHDSKSKDRRKTRVVHTSFRAYMVVAFSMVSAITAVLIISIVAVVFNMYFTNYTSDNIEAAAKYAASRVAYDYERAGNLNVLDYSSLADMLNIGENASLMVFDKDGKAVYDSNNSLGAVASAGGNTTLASDQDAERAAMLSNATQVAVAEITPGTRSVGTVRIWVYDSDALMSKVDLELRDSILIALLLAGVVAVLIAILISFWFSHTLISPIKRIANAAEQLAVGNFTVRTGMRGKNEIGRLAEAFDEMAESIERDRKLEMRLTSDVAHELRTPLMAIQVTVEAMQDGVYEPDSEHLALVNEEVRRLSRLVDALLKLSRLEMRSQPMNEEICDLGELAQSIVASHELFAKESGLRLKAHVNDRVKSYCDRDMIRQAVANLISNAVRYTPEGGRIDVYVRRDGDYAAIDVADTGIGLTPEEERMVFSRFWRADAGRARESGGLGIGLAVVKEIIMRHGGKVGVRGIKDVGSTFTLLLPLYNEEQSQREARAALKAFEKRQKFDSEVARSRQVASGAVNGEEVLVGDESGGKVPGEITPGMTGEIRIPDDDELIG